MNNQARRLLALLLLVLLGQSLSGLFVQAYMWERGGDLGAVGRFNFTLFLAMAVAFLAMGPMVKRGRSVIAVRLGLLFQFSFYLLVLALGDQAGGYLELLGAVSGLGHGAFWVGQNMLIQQATEPGERSRYWSYVGASWALTALIGPFTGSRLVAGLGATLGYQVVFSLTAAGYAAAALVSAGLVTRASDQPYRLADGLADRLPGRPWWRALGAFVISGFRDGVLGFLPLLLVYVVTGDPRMMGNFSLLTSAVATASNWLTGRLLQRRHWLAAMLVSGLVQAGAALLMLSNLSVTTLLLYSLVVAVAGPLMGVPFLSHTFDTIGAGGGDTQMERIVWREVFLVVGRCAGMLLLLGLSRWFGHEPTAMIILAVAAVAAVLPALIMGRTIGTQHQPGT
ncbi:MAG: MFS transporter [Bacillota bacterium]